VAFQFPSSTTYFELHDIPYARTDEGREGHGVFNCAFEPPHKVNEFQRLPGWRQISKKEFERLRALFAAAQEWERGLRSKRND